MSKMNVTVDLDDSADVAQVVRLLTLHLSSELGMIGAPVGDSDWEDESSDTAPPPPETVADVPPPPETVADAPPPPEIVADVPPPPPGEDVELDSAGEAWDPNKHSEGKSKLVNGRWRARRNSRSAGTEAPASKKPAPPPPGPDSAMAPEELNYKTMVDKLKGAGIDHEAMNLLAEQLGLSSIVLVVSRPELIPQVLALAGLE